MSKRDYITLGDSTGATAVIAPELGGWLLRYARTFADQGEVDALHFDPAVVERYPNEMYAGNPILFPLASFNHCDGYDHHYAWGDARFPMPQHGFARRRPWSVAELSDTAATIELVDDDVTRAAYPFAFRHRITYRLVEGQLQWEQVIANRGDRPMPFSAGFHPYLRVPLTERGERSECFVEIPEARRLVMRGRGERFTARAFPAQQWSVGKDVSETVFLSDLRLRELNLVDPLSELEVVLNWEEAPAYRFAALWSRSTDEPFFCLEPWTALSNAFSRSDANELVVLAPGEELQAAFGMELRPY
jgi:galactose mutarotase-like enzyme